MKLFQYEQFLEKHPDPEVKKTGGFLLGIIDQLQASLSITQDWASAPAMPGLTRFEQMKLSILLYALERKGGHKSEAAKWLGVSRETMYAARKHLNLKKATNVIPLTDKKYEESNLASAGNSVECLPIVKTVSRRRSGAAS